MKTKVLSWLLCSRSACSPSCFCNKHVSVSCLTKWKSFFSLQINRTYQSLDEVLGKSLNAIVNCHFREKIDGFGKFMLFLRWILGECVWDKEFKMDKEPFSFKVLLSFHEKKMGLNIINVLYLVRCQRVKDLVSVPLFIFYYYQKPSEVWGVRCSNGLNIASWFLSSKYSSTSFYINGHLIFKIYQCI